MALKYLKISGKISSKPKSRGIFSQSVFLDVFRPPDHDSRVHLPLKGLAQALAFLSCYAVRHCTTIVLAAGAGEPPSVLRGLFRALRAMRLYLIGDRTLIVEADASYIKGMLSNPDF